MNGAADAKRVSKPAIASTNKDFGKLIFNATIRRTKSSYETH
jgi:hypothetical protein